MIALQVLTPLGAAVAFNPPAVYLGKGDGTFDAPSFFDAGAATNGTNFGPIYAADFNGDHRPDLAVSTYDGISILLGDGNGFFQPYRAVLPGYSLLAVGGFSGDGKSDLVAYAGSPWVGIALGNGDGTFKSPSTVFVTGLLSVDRTIVGNFNGDGKLDIAFISSSEQMLPTLPGNGNGTFGQRIDLPTENSPWSLTAAKGLTGGGESISLWERQLLEGRMSSLSVRVARWARFIHIRCSSVLRRSLQPANLSLQRCATLAVRRSRSRRSRPQGNLFTPTLVPKFCLSALRARSACSSSRALSEKIKEL